MKANKAPKKIYLIRNFSSPTALNTTNDHRGKFLNEWYKSREKDTDVEYTQTDAFIEKALKWYCLDCECNDKCKDTKCFFHNAYKRYLEGDTNCLPPKISNTILNEDGSTSDNWCYRHFIAKMQEAFIEKACEWLKESVTNNPKCNRIISKKGVITMGELIKDFRKYMKGE